MSRLKIPSLVVLLLVVLAPVAGAGTIRVCLSARGYDGPDMDVYLLDRDGGNVTNVTNHISGDKVLARVSPDGTKLAFHRYVPDGYTSTWDAIQVMDLATGAITHTLTSTGQAYRLGDWLDDDTLLYSQVHGGVHTVDLDGTDTPIPGGSGWSYRPRVSDDGTKIVCDFAAAYNAYSMDLYVHTLGTPGWAPLVTAGNRDSHATWSRDGSLVYYQHEQIVPSRDQFMAATYPGGATSLIRPHQFEVALHDAAPDRDELLFSTGSASTTVWIRDLATGTETAIFTTSGRNLNAGAFYYETSEIPEPGTLGLLVVGLAGLVVGARRRRRRA
jgi:Tol biopolymer transport system component